MHASHHKCENQKPRHTPERPEEPWILARIMMRRMRQVSREPAICARMARLAGLHDVLTTEPRARIAHRQNVMSTMAVVTFGCFRVSQLRHFSVICVEICFSNIFMAPATLRHDLKLEPFIVRAPNGMGGMAIVADRKLLVRLPYLCNVYALTELLLNAMVAATTCCRDIFRIDA